MNTNRNKEDIISVVILSLRHKKWEPIKIGNGEYVLKYLSTENVLFYIYMTIDLHNMQLRFSGQFPQSFTNELEIQALLYLCSLTPPRHMVGGLVLEMKERLIVYKVGMSMDDIDLCAQVVFNPLIAICTGLEELYGTVEEIINKKVYGFDRINKISQENQLEWRKKKDILDWSIVL